MIPKLGRTTARLSATAMLLTALSISTPALAETDAYMRIKAGRQGDIKGSVTQKGRENSIRVSAVDHTLSLPIDAASGMSAGRRVHKPITITKEMDRSSVQLRTAFVTNEVLSQVVLQFWAPTTVGKGAAAVAGAESQYFTITLKNARIAGIHHVMPHNKDAALARTAVYEEISLAYDEIAWTWTDGNVTATDTWSSAR